MSMSEWFLGWRKCFNTDTLSHNWNLYLPLQVVLIYEPRYNSFGPELTEARFRARKLISKYNNTRILDHMSPEDLVAERETALHELFGSSGSNIYVEPPLFVDYGCNIIVGDNFYANFQYVYYLIRKAPNSYTKPISSKYHNARLLPYHHRRQGRLWTKRQSSSRYTSNECAIATGEERICSGNLDR